MEAPGPSSGFKGTVNMKSSLVFLTEVMLRLKIGYHVLFLPRAWSEPSSLRPYRATRVFEGGLQLECVSPSCVGQPTPGHIYQVGFPDGFGPHLQGDGGGCSIVHC